MSLDVRSLISRGVTRGAHARARLGWIGLDDVVLAQLGACLHGAVASSSVLGGSVVEAPSIDGLVVPHPTFRGGS